MWKLTKKKKITISVCACVLELEKWICDELEHLLALDWRNVFAVCEPSPLPDGNSSAGMD